MCRKVVHDQEVAGSDVLDKRVSDVTFEDQRIHRAINNQRCNHALRGQRSHKCGGVPMTVGFKDGQALALGSITTVRVHVCGEGGFIQNNQTARFFTGNASVPSSAGLDLVRPFLLSGHNRFFYGESQTPKGSPHGKSGYVETQLIPQLAGIYSWILGNQFAQLLLLVLGETELGTALLLLEDHQGACLTKQLHQLADEPWAY